MAASASVTPGCVAAAVYDVTQPESFENLERIWMKEVDIYSNIEDAVKMVVANKVDLVRTTITLQLMSLRGHCAAVAWAP